MSTDVALINVAFQRGRSYGLSTVRLPCSVVVFSVRGSRCFSYRVVQPYVIGVRLLKDLIGSVQPWVVAPVLLDLVDDRHHYCVANSTDYFLNAVWPNTVQLEI
jgi:hypothetical protein